MNEHVYSMCPPEQPSTTAPSTSRTSNQGWTVFYSVRSEAQSQCIYIFIETIRMCLYLSRGEGGGGRGGV